MTPVSERTFGILIAYVIPGYVTVYLTSRRSPWLTSWLGIGSGTQPSVGGFLYVTVASITAGLTISTVRWAIIDHIHERTGIPAPAWDFARLQEHIDAFDAAIQHHYRYYQAYGNAVVAILLAVAIEPSLVMGWREAFWFLALTILFFVASRDALRKYYVRTSGIVQNSQVRRNEMTNGAHPPTEAASEIKGHAIGRDQSDPQASDNPESSDSSS